MNSRDGLATNLMKLRVYLLVGHTLDRFERPELQLIAGCCGISVLQLTVCVDSINA